MGGSMPAHVKASPGNMSDITCQHGDAPGVAYGIGATLQFFDDGIVDTVANDADEIIAVSDYIYTLIIYFVFCFQLVSVCDWLTTELKL